MASKIVSAVTSLSLCAVGTYAVRSLLEYPAHSPYEQETGIERQTRVIGHYGRCSDHMLTAQDAEQDLDAYSTE
jgi:hypothetical protein